MKALGKIETVSEQKWRNCQNRQEFQAKVGKWFNSPNLEVVRNIVGPKWGLRGSGLRIAYAPNSVSWCGHVTSSVGGCSNGNSPRHLHTFIPRQLDWRVYSVQYTWCLRVFNVLFEFQVNPIEFVESIYRFTARVLSKSNFRECKSGNV